MGNASINPSHPLKILHGILDNGLVLNEKGYCKTVPTIGVSSYTMDFAIMNRGVLVYTELPDINEILKVFNMMLNNLIQERWKDGIRAVILTKSKMYEELYYPSKFNDVESRLIINDSNIQSFEELQTLIDKKEDTKEKLIIIRCSIFEKLHFMHLKTFFVHMNKKSGIQYHIFIAYYGCDNKYFANLSTFRWPIYQSNLSLFFICQIQEELFALGSLTASEMQNKSVLFSYLVQCKHLIYPYASFLKQRFYTGDVFYFLFSGYIQFLCENKLTFNEEIKALKCISDRISFIVDSESHANRLIEIFDNL